MSIAVPVVGGLRINIVKDFDLFIKIDDASRLLMGEYKKKVPLSATCPGNVDGKYYIIATVNLPRGTPVCNLPVEYNSFPVIVDYGIMKASTSERCHEYHENIKPGISISDSECNGAFTLGTIFTTESQPGKKYLLTVNHGVGEIQLLTISKYNDLSIDEDGQLLDFAFCEIDNKRGLLATNKPCGSDSSIKDVNSTLDCENSAFIPVQKIGRTTGHTNGYMRNIMQEILIDEPFEKVTFAKVLVVYGYFGDRGDSGSPVYDEYGLWGIYQSTSESKYFSGVVPIELILQKVYEKECTNFDLLVDEMEEENVDEENDN
uniref:Trypsin-like serine protease n=1 Tax=Rhizophagus irregularis (strain DAOM 181602 / DAOM 197198 / MUCL 43194) TaxID=747089 RepID=U9UHY2_RHIID